ncbi:hypothetical protein COCON_G00198880 [Conger conger]|uniref:Uncharacterized protein n=1 Tax=Conger conger TaxID=82655 RepID=A0A9Q1HR24_CONCO|nr:hypothetical protein COCON_G00198880 [Conger conger]
MHGGEEDETGREKRDQEGISGGNGRMWNNRGMQVVAASLCLPLRFRLITEEQLHAHEWADTGSFPGRIGGTQPVMDVGHGRGRFSRAVASVAEEGIINPLIYWGVLRPRARGSIGEHTKRISPRVAT